MTPTQTGKSRATLFRLFQAKVDWDNEQVCIFLWPNSNNSHLLWIQPSVFEVQVISGKRLEQMAAKRNVHSLIGHQQRTTNQKSNHLWSADLVPCPIAPASAVMCWCLLNVRKSMLDILNFARWVLLRTSLWCWPNLSGWQMGCWLTEWSINHVQSPRHIAPSWLRELLSRYLWCFHCRLLGIFLHARLFCMMAKSFFGVHSSALTLGHSSVGGTLHLCLQV